MVFKVVLTNKRGTNRVIYESLQIRRVVSDIETILWGPKITCSLRVYSYYEINVFALRVNILVLYLIVLHFRMLLKISHK